jgi:TolB protein
MVKRFLFFLAILSFSLPVLAQEPKLEVTGAELVKIPVAVPDFEGPLPLSVELARVARHDLELQMLFRVLGEGLSLKETKLFSSLGVNYLLAGKVVSSGNYLRLVFHLEDVVKEEVVLSRGYQGPIASGRYMVHRFVDLAVREMIGTPGVALSRVAYVRRQRGGDELVVQDFDGFRRARVIHGEGLVLYPRLSPNGRYIAFVSYRNHRPEIHLIDLFSGKRRPLAAYPGLNSSPVWHPSGDKLVVTLSKDGSLDLYLLDLSGHIIKRLTHGEGVNTGGSFSPDGSELAFVSDRAGSPQIYILNLSTGGVRRLTFQGHYNAWPSWSPTGERIVYAGLKDGKFALFTIDPHGGEPVQITEEGNFEAPCFAPNGRLILAQGNDGLYLILANGASIRRYLEGPFLFPTWASLR